MKNLLKNPFFYVSLLLVIVTFLIIGLYVTQEKRGFIGQLPQSNSVENWSCGDSVTFVYKGSSVTYGTVKSQDKCWLDRNLGALQVAIAYNDANAYGDLFQWGRGDDGHQQRDSEITLESSNSDDPGHSNFILVDSKSYNWRDPQNDNLWQGISGTNNPCPLGFRIPTEAEWDFERASWNGQHAGGAFMSPLKLTLIGYRSINQDSHYPQSLSEEGVYWSSTVSDERAIALGFDETATFSPNDSNSYVTCVAGNAIIAPAYRVASYAVRCIKD
jgi:uncharacterized protein (TIGR02145 family)